MKEEEAKTKWCPIAGIINSISGLSNKCIGSECMMWQWNISPFDNTVLPDGRCGLARKQKRRRL